MTISERVIAAYEKALDGIATVKEVPKSELEMCIRFRGAQQYEKVGEAIAHLFDSIALSDLRARIVFEHYLDKGKEPTAIGNTSNCVAESKPLRFNYCDSQRIFQEPYISVAVKAGISARPNPEYNNAERQILLGKNGRVSILMHVEVKGDMMTVYRSFEILEMPTIYEMDVPHLNLVAA